MRAWKNNKGVIAYLVLVVGFVALEGVAMDAPSRGLQPRKPLATDENSLPEVKVKNDGMPLAPPKDLLPPQDPESPLPPPHFRDDLPKPGENSDGPPNGGINGKRPPFVDPRKKTPPPMPPRQNNVKNAPPKPVTQNDDITHVVPQKCVPAKGQFYWNFEKEELINVLRQVSDLVCKTIVVNDTIGKNLEMTIIGKSPLTSKDAWDVLMASLAAKGLALVEQGKIWTVLKRSETKSYATPMYANGGQAGNNEGIGTLFYKVQHTSQDVLKNVARVLISKDGLVESIGDHFIIVIDSNSNIRRLGHIFAQVDIEDALNKVHIVKLHNADAKTVEKQLRDLFDVATGGQRPRRRNTAAAEGRSALEIDKIIADERTNSLIVISDKDSVEKLKEVVALIDQPATDQSTKGKIHVKKLKFADAKKIAETLSTVVSQGRGGNRFGRRRDEGTSELFEGDVKITAHESTNTLVTVASANDYRSLLATIDQLDERRKQVYVEAVILDLQVKDTSAFGINLFSGVDPGTLGGSLGFMANPGGKSIVEGIKSGVTSSVTGTNINGLGDFSIGAIAVLSNFISGGVAGIVGPKIGNGLDVPSFGAVLQATLENANVDILSTPYLLTTDNQEAEMSVGEKVPVLRGASTIGGGLGGALGSMPMQDVRHEDVKLTFKITPHVGADNNVRLEINQEVNELGLKEKIMNQDQYHISTKSAKTTLVLKDQQTGVIGGLMHHKDKRTDSKVPFLGDIPIIGYLFKNTASVKERRSLLLILTVYVINTEEDYRKILDRKLKEREEFARLYYGGKLKNYNPHIDYDKKAGPISGLLLSVDTEMKKVENGGPGDGSELVITPKESPKEKSQKTVPSVNIDNSASDANESAHAGDAPLGGGEFGVDNFPFEEFLEPDNGRSGG